MLVIAFDRGDVEAVLVDKGEAEGRETGQRGASSCGGKTQECVAVAGAGEGDCRSSSG